MFQQGALDMFILRGLVDVGAFTYLRIGHDASGQNSGTGMKGQYLG